MQCSIAMLVVHLFTTTLLAQKTEKFQLLDNHNGDVITEATWQYADQSGLSDSQGIIEFIFVQDEVMYLSHLSYGKWSVNEKEIVDAIKAGILSREKLMIDLYPVTVISLRSEKNKKTSLELDYEDKMAHDGGQLLSRIPAISGIRKSGSYGFDPVLRGFKYDQLNVVVNGAQSATAACPNRMDPPTSQMSPNMMDKVEVFKGPHALRYGNSFGGTINFVSQAAYFPENSETYGRLSGGFESNGEVIRSEGLLGFRGNKYDLGIFASWSQGNDYLDGDKNTIPADFLRSSFGTNIGLKISHNQEFTFSATRNLARDADFPALPMDLRNDDTWMFNANHKISVEESILQSWNTTIYSTFVDHLMNNYLKNIDPRRVDAETNASTVTYGGRTESVWKPSDNILFAGADFKVEEAEGIRTREFLMGPNSGQIVYDNAWQHGRISKTSLFAEYHWNMNKLRFVFSGRLELNNSKILDPQSEFTDVYDETKANQLNPAVSLGFVRPVRSMTIGLWLGRAQRSGSLTERYINYFPVGQDPYEMLGNPQLKPEVNNQADLTFVFNTLNTNLDLDIFVSYLQKNISSVIDTNLTPRMPSSPGVRQYNNIDQALKTGFEVVWTQKLPIGLKHQLSIAYTYGQDIERDEPLPEIAPFDFRFSLLGNYFRNKLKPEINLRYVYKQDRISSEFGETTTPSFTTMDIIIAYRFNKIWSVSGGVQNLFDKTYYEHLNRNVKGTTPKPLNAPGRNFFLSVSVNFMDN